MSRVTRKPVFGVSNQVRHKSGCTATEDGFWIKEVEGLYYLCSKKKGADQLHGYRTADLPLCFHICKKQVFSCCSSTGSGVSFVCFYEIIIFCIVVAMCELVHNVETMVHHR